MNLYAVVDFNPKSNGEINCIYLTLDEAQIQATMLRDYWSAMFSGSKAHPVYVVVMPVIGKYEY